MGIYASPVASALLLLGITFGITVNSPQVLVVPEEKSWSTPETVIEMRKEYELNRVSFSLPRHFRVVEETKNRVVFESDTNETVLRAFF